jgi:ABC-type bacteriocin/lantibiotic exporter with double-glycine peptidase domain
LLRDPAIVVLDEPTSALDGEATRDIGRLVKELSASRSVLVVAHRAETVALASRVLILEEGAVAFDGPLEQARRQPLFVRLFPGMHSVADGAARAPAKSH